MKITAFWKPIIGGILITPFCVLLAILSSGAGHGNFLYAKILFPYTMLSALQERLISMPFLLFGIFQFPLYGLIYARAMKKRKQGSVAIVLVIAHILAVILCLQLANPNYR
jgi:hypothetical protein